MPKLHLIAAVSSCLISHGMAHAAPQSTSPTAASAAALGEETRDFEQIGRFIYAFHRAGANIDTLRDPELARNAPPALAARARALSEKYDAIIKVDARLPDDAIRATLREAADIGAAVADWRTRHGK